MGFSLWIFTETKATMHVFLTEFELVAWIKKQLRIAAENEDEDYINFGSSLDVQPMQCETVFVITNRVTKEVLLPTHVGGTWMGLLKHSTNEWMQNGF